ncbi:COG3637 Opacity protein and related surface antigens [Rhabdaerophilaceae bacterium]
MMSSRSFARSCGTHLGSLAMAALLNVPVAHAADYLRGTYGGHSEPQKQSSGVDWAGVYAGGHGGLSATRSNYEGIGRTLGLNVLPNLAITDQIPPLINLGSATKQGTTFGAFAGVNYLWDDVVLGLEVDYTRSSVASQSTSPSISRSLSAASTGTDVWSTTVSASARGEIKNWYTARARVGWAAGYFMPYLTAGLAFGQITTNGRADGSTSQYAVTADPVTARPVLTLRGSTSNTATTRYNGLTFGGAVGAGVDMAFFSNVFLRAEWQYIQFASGGTRPEVVINTARVAGAVKF